jgi:hypothetical protein
VNKASLVQKDKFEMVPPKDFDGLFKNVALILMVKYYGETP